MLYRSIYPQPTLSAHHRPSAHNQTQIHPVKFPQDLQIILRSDRYDYGNLYIGNIEAALNTQLLEKLKIDAILSVAEGSPITHPQNIIRHCSYIPIPDDQKENISEQIFESVAFLQSNLLVTNVLVHCVSGGWRSSVPAIAYLIKSRRLSSEDAQSEVLNRRKIIKISDHIRYQLKKYEVDLNNTSPRKSKYNHSMRVSTKKSQIPHNNSYFDAQSYDSPESAITGANDPKNISIRHKSHQNNKSKSFIKEELQGNPPAHPKIYTKAENPEHSVTNDHKKWNSMIGLEKGSIKKAKTLQKTVKMSSEAPSLSSFHEPIQIQCLNSEGSDVYLNTALRMQKKRSKSREQFQNRLRLIDLRNININDKLRNVQDTFDKTTQANQLLFECELKQIKMIEEQIIKQYQDRSTVLRKRFSTHKNTENENRSMISMDNGAQGSNFSSFSEVAY